MREALNRLSAEGLVTQQDQKGFQVADINEAELQELIQTRCILNDIMIPLALAKAMARGKSVLFLRIIIYQRLRHSYLMELSTRNIRSDIEIFTFLYWLLAVCDGCWSFHRNYWTGLSDTEIFL